MFCFWRAICDAFDLEKKIVKHKDIYFIYSGLFYTDLCSVFYLWFILKKNLVRLTIFDPQKLHL